MAVKTDFRTLTREQVRATLDEFERRYNVASDHLTDAFTGPDGKLRETQDFLDWTHAYAAWRLFDEA